MTATRVQRLRAAVLAVDQDELRGAIRAIGEETVRALPGRSRPLVSQLRRAPSPADLLRKLPDAAVVAVLADEVSEACFQATRDALGDAADDPNREQLLAAIETILADFDISVVRVMLAAVATAEAEAADLCDDLLQHDERFAIEVAPTGPTSVTREPKPPASDEVKARRRERKEAERAARQRAASAAKAPKPKREPAPAVPTPAADRATEVPTVSRRRPALAADEARTFDVDDPLVGSVVIAVVPFDEPHSQFGAKARPAVVIGVAAEELLVRPGYSEGGLQSRRWQTHELRDLSEAGCTKPTWIEDVRRVVPRSDVGEPIGRLSDRDWNALW